MDSAKSIVVLTVMVAVSATVAFADPIVVRGPGELSQSPSGQNGVYDAGEGRTRMREYQAALGVTEVGLVIPSQPRGSYWWSCRGGDRPATAVLHGRRHSRSDVDPRCGETLTPLPCGWNSNGDRGMAVALLGQIRRARNLLKQLIVGLLEMSPQKERYYTYRSTGAVLPIVAAALPQGVASPPGFVALWQASFEGTMPRA
jgi:hypothetical protein